MVKYVRSQNVDLAETNNFKAIAILKNCDRARLNFPRSRIASQTKIQSY